MLPPRRRGKFEVLVEQKGKPSIDGVFDDEKMAVDRAKYLLAQAKFSLVQVSKINDAGKEDVIFQKGYSGGGKVTTISHIDAANVCQDVYQVYSFESRMTLLRLLRSYWDEQQVIPAEQLHRYYPLRYLEREAVLFNPSLSRLATLQAPEMGLKVFDRQDQLSRLFVKIKELAQQSDTLAPYDKALLTGGTSGLLLAAMERPPEERDRIVTHAFSSFLEPHREWGAKVVAILRFLDENDAESVRICDEFLAEAIDGREPIKNLIGYSPDLGSALMSLIATTHGVLDDRLPNTPELLALSNAVGVGGMEQVEKVLIDRIAGALEGSNRLTRGDAAEEVRSYFTLLDRLTAIDGYRGGPKMAAALTKRGKMAMGSDGEDLSFEDTVQRLSTRLSSPASRVGFLLDLAASPFGKRKISVLIEAVANIFNGVRSASELAPTGMPAEDARLRYAERLRAAGIPRALANALIARMAGLPDTPPPATLETVDVARRHELAPRLVLVFHDHQFAIPDHGEELVIGRSKRCDVLIDAPSASRQHATIARKDGAFVLTDSSRNGTYVAPEKGEARTLANGESLQLENHGEIVIGTDEDGPTLARITWLVTVG